MQLIKVKEDEKIIDNELIKLLEIRLQILESKINFLGLEKSKSRNSFEKE